MSGLTVSCLAVRRTASWHAAAAAAGAGARVPGWRALRPHPPPPAPYRAGTGPRTAASPTTTCKPCALYRPPCATLRRHWAEYCNISYHNMVGFRAPNYYNNPPIRKVRGWPARGSEAPAGWQAPPPATAAAGQPPLCDELAAAVLAGAPRCTPSPDTYCPAPRHRTVPQALAENGYLYDSTIIERWYPNNPTSPAADKMLWPYTKDAGIPQVGCAALSHRLWAAVAGCRALRRGRVGPVPAAPRGGASSARAPISATPHPPEQECGFMGPEVGKCQGGEKYKGLWEVPLYQSQRGDEMMGVGSEWRGGWVLCTRTPAACCRALAVAAGVAGGRCLRPGACQPPARPAAGCRPARRRCLC